MPASIGVVERCLAFVGGTAVVAAAAAGSARWLCSAGIAVDKSMESLFDDVLDFPAVDG